MWIHITKSYPSSRTGKILLIRYSYNKRYDIQGSRVGAVARALASHQCVPGSILGPSVMWVEFVVGSPHCSERFFSGYSGFPLSFKTHFQIPIRSWNAPAFLNEFLWTFWCSVGKQITYLHLHFLFDILLCSLSRWAITNACCSHWRIPPIIKGLKTRQLYGRLVWPISTSTFTTWTKSKESGFTLSPYSVEGHYPGSREGSKEWMMISGLFVFCGTFEWHMYIGSHLFKELYLLLNS